MTDDTFFTQFDRSLYDLQDSVARANLTMRYVVERYVAMMNALDAAFLLFYEDMPAEEQAKMKAAFDKLADTVRTVEDDELPDNVHTIK
jgi:hypothetical protein